MSFLANAAMKAISESSEMQWRWRRNQPAQPASAMAISSWQWLISNVEISSISMAVNT